MSENVIIKGAIQHYGLMVPWKINTYDQSVGNYLTSSVRKVRILIPNLVDFGHDKPPLYTEAALHLERDGAIELRDALNAAIDAVDNPAP